MTISALEEVALGTSDLTGGDVDLAYLPDGDLIAVNYLQNSATVAQIGQSAIEFLKPSDDSLANITSTAVSGALPSNIGSMPIIDELPVGGNALPDIILPEGGLDQAPWNGGRLRVLAPNASGQYVDVTSELTQQTTYIHRATVGEINGQAAIVIDTAANQVGNLEGTELFIANADGTFSNWSSHLPAAYASFTGVSATPDIFTASAIADFTGHGGDIFLGTEFGINPNVLLENNGSGQFSAVPLTGIARPTFADGAIGTVVYAMPTHFDGDTNEDLIVDYADYNNQTGNAYYLQFLKGDGHGGFTDVTAQDFPNQPKMTDGFGGNAWVLSTQSLSLNGQNVLVLNVANGAPVFLTDNGQGVFSPAAVQIPVASVGNFPTSLTYSTWGVDDGVEGFYGYTNGNQIVFIPVSSAYLGPTSASINQPFADHLYLYGDGAGAPTATALSQTFDTSISVSVTAAYAPGANQTVDLTVNGVDLGTRALGQVAGAVDPSGTVHTVSQTFTFKMPGLVSINSLAITEGLPGLSVADVQVDGVDLGNQTQYTSTTSQTLSASAWNAALVPALGTSAAPIQVVGTGSDVTAYVLGRESDYSITPTGAGTYSLRESDGLGQNANLSGIAHIAFQDGEVLDLAGAGGGQVLQATAASPTVVGGAGADTITGGPVDDYLRGGQGDDSIQGGSAFNDMNGNMGNDTVHGGTGTNWVVGGQGDDSLVGGGGYQDLVLGNLGNDTLHAGAQANVLRGGQGDDSIVGGAGNDYISGDLGNDTVSGGGGADIFHGSVSIGMMKVLDFNYAQGDRVELDPGTVYSVAQVGADTVITVSSGGQMDLVGVQLSTLPSDWIFEGYLSHL